MSLTIENFPLTVSIASLGRLSPEAAAASNSNGVSAGRSGEEHTTVTSVPLGSQSFMRFISFRMQLSLKRLD